MASPVNRREFLAGSATLVGIDFVEVEPNTQVELWVYFIGNPATVFGGAAFTSPQDVRIQSLSDAASLPEVTVLTASWAFRSGRDVLHVVTETPGDFSRYALTLLDSLNPSRVDPFFNGVAFRFQAGCQSELDCETTVPQCPPTTEPDVAIDYTARDFHSYRRALIEFASLRWPQWSDRLEADVGVMLMEAMAALADEMSYTQDRVAREASLRSAVERRSVRKHARLLDHELHDGLAAWTWIRVLVDVGLPAVFIPSGTGVTTRTLLDPNGNELGAKITFEIGRGLNDTQPGSVVTEAHNDFTAWVWDENETCLEQGSTSLSIEGQWRTGAEPLFTGADKWVLLQTIADGPSVVERAQVVRLTGAVEVFDPVLNTWTTRLEWASQEATKWAMDLTQLHIFGNLVPASAGRTVPAPAEAELLYRITNPSNLGSLAGWTLPLRSAVERVGANGTKSYLLPLLATRNENLCFLGETPEAARPEVRVEVLSMQGDPTPAGWSYRQTLAGSPAATGSDEVFTLDDGTWDDVARYYRGGAEPFVHTDYRSGDGFVVRFGDGSLGAIPNPDSVFRVTYRVGGGSSGNLSAHTLVETHLAGITVDNPLPIDSGMEPESLDQARRLAPHAWQAKTFRAVRPEDYAEALMRLAWVDRAGARLRWTGSWLTVFATPDPAGQVTLDDVGRREGQAQLDRFRQAGRQAHICDPVYAWLDLVITVCVDVGASRSDVQVALLKALFGGNGEQGFFAPDRFTFGDGLVRSQLYASLQSVSGVRAIENIKLRRRGHFRWRDFSEEELTVGVNEILGIAHNPLYPERGAVSLVMEGGA